MDANRMRGAHGAVTERKQKEAKSKSQEIVWLSKRIQAFSNVDSYEEILPIKNDDWDGNANEYK